MSCRFSLQPQSNPSDDSSPMIYRATMGTGSMPARTSQLRGYIMLDPHKLRKKKISIDCLCACLLFILFKLACKILDITIAFLNEVYFSRLPPPPSSPPSQPLFQCPRITFDLFSTFVVQMLSLLPTPFLNTFSNHSWSPLCWAITCHTTTFNKDTHRHIKI